MQFKQKQAGDTFELTSRRLLFFNCHKPANNILILRQDVQRIFQKPYIKREVEETMRLQHWKSLALEHAITVVKQRQMVLLCSKFSENATLPKDSPFTNLRKSFFVGFDYFSLNGWEMDKINYFRRGKP